MAKMELNINSPKYYKDVYGVDDEIYRLCQDIYIYFKDKSYSEIINIIGIIPIIAPKELLEKGKYKEVKHCSVAYGFADVNLFIDYEKYVEDDAGPAGGVLRELRHGAGRQITATNQG